MKTSATTTTVLTAGAGDITTTPVSVADFAKSGVLITIVNGDPAPGAGAQIQPQISADGVVFRDYGGPYVAGITADGVYPFPLDLPKWAMAVQVIAGSNTTNNVTLIIDVVTVKTVVRDNIKSISF